MSYPVTLYGIANCDTIKKAKAWLGEHDIAFEFHDYRKQGLTDAQLRSMVSELGWEALLNRRGTTWRALPDEVKDHVDQAAALRIMLDNPAIIKRPVLAKDDQFHLGFNARQYQEIFE